MGSHWWLSGVPSLAGWFPHLDALVVARSHGEPSENPPSVCSPSPPPAIPSSPRLCPPGIIRQTEQESLPRRARRAPCSPQFSESSGSAWGAPPPLWAGKPPQCKVGPAATTSFASRSQEALSCRPWLPCPINIVSCPSSCSLAVWEEFKPVPVIPCEHRGHPSSLFSCQNSETFSCTSLAWHRILL